MTQPLDFVYAVRERKLACRGWYRSLDLGRALRVVALVFASAVAFAPAAAEPGAEAAAKSKSPEFIAIGLPSAWERPFSFFEVVGAGADWECTPFAVRSLLPRRAKLLITTSGIAGARLGAGPSGSRQPCKVRAGKAATALSTSLSPGAQADVWLMVPVSSFPAAAEGGKGALIVIPTPGEPTTIDVTFRRQPPPPVLQAFQWLVGIVVPLVASGWLAVCFARAQKRDERSVEEQDVLQTFRTDSREQLSSFFSGLYHNIRQTEGERAPARMQTELAEQGIISALPASDGAAVTALVRQGNWTKLDSKLALLFPEQRALIMRDGKTS